MMPLPMASGDGTEVCQVIVYPCSFHDFELEFPKNASNLDEI